ncbi:MFS transporter [Rhizobium jaguaris]|nr:MFS transporter [Rhizobium jaguaris]
MKSVIFPRGSLFHPLGNRVFRRFWFASLFSHSGIWACFMTTSWIMSDLSSDPSTAASVQTALYLPVVLLAIVAGYLVDQGSPRFFLLSAHWALMIATIAAIVLIVFGALTEKSLWFLTFVCGCGFAFVTPAWNSIAASVVPKSHALRSAVLGSFSYSLARLVVSVLGGIALSHGGSLGGMTVVCFCLLFSIALFTVVIPQEYHSFRTCRLSFPANVLGSFNANIRMICAAGFMTSIGASVVWALLPLLVKRMHSGPTMLGLQMALLGFGAVASIALIHVLAPRLSFRTFLAVMTLQLSSGIAVYALTLDLPADMSTVVLSISSFAIGIAWTISQSLMTGACLQLSAPGAAATAIGWYLTSSYLGFALASPLWGLISRISLLHAFTGSAAVAATSAIYTSIAFPTIERTLSNSDGAQKEHCS